MAACLQMAPQGLPAHTGPKTAGRAGERPRLSPSGSPGMGGPHGDLQGWLIPDRGNLGRELGPLGVAGPGTWVAGKDMAAWGGRLCGDG